MYDTIIFDLDDTLTDDRANIKEAFKILMKAVDEEFKEENFDRFYKIDKQTWRDRASGKLVSPYEDNKEKKTEWVRSYRFREYYNNKITYEESVHMSNIYTEGMKEVVVSREGCYEIIKYLYDKGYKIIIATNGPLIPLVTKLKKLDIYKFLHTFFAAEEVGFMKPNPKYYEGLFKKANIDASNKILFIGDDLEKDIKGGIDNNLDVCWCNYKNEKNELYDTKFEIHSLEELKEIL